MATQGHDLSGTQRDRARGREHGPGMSATVLACAAAAVLLAGVGVSRALDDGHPSPPVLPPAGEFIAGDGRLSFAVLGDCKGNLEVLRRVLDRVTQEDVGLVLLVGDIVEHCDGREFARILELLRGPGPAVPLCPVAGNHDIDAEAADSAGWHALYNRSFGPQRYWFACGDTLFVAFDTSTEQCTEEELGWLEATLRRLRGSYRHCIALTHVPPRDPRPYHRHGLRSGGEALMEVLAAGGVDALFTGHIHGFFEDLTGVVPVIVSGGAGSELEDPADCYHYLVCTVEADGSLSVQRRDLPPVP